MLQTCYAVSTMTSIPDQGSGIPQGDVAEDYPLSPVPAAARKSLISLAPILAGFTLYSGTLFAGGLVGPSFQFWPNMVLLVLDRQPDLGGVCRSAGLSSPPKPGLTTVLMARFSFGNAWALAGWTSSSGLPRWVGMPGGQP
jgi:cytosine permease